MQLLDGDGLAEMAAGRFSLQAIRAFAARAAERLRAQDVPEYREYEPLRHPADSGLTVLPPLSQPPEVRRNYIGWASLAGAVVVHGCVLAYVLTHPLLPVLVPAMSGASQTASAPLSIEMIDTKVFEAMQRGQDTQATGASAQAAAAVAADPKTTAAIPEPREPPPPEIAKPSAPPEEAAQEQPAPKPEQQAAVAPPADTPPVLAVDAPAELATPPKQETAPEMAATQPQESRDPPGASTEKLAPERTTAEPHSQPQEKLASQQPHRRRQASVASRASAGEGTESAAAQVSASRGAVLSYRSRVQAHLAANKPFGGMGAGTVVIALALSPSGRLISAHVSRSSGNRDLDRAALNATRGASPFPAPPQGISRSQLYFAFPFYFR